MADQGQSWWGIRMVVEIPSVGGRFSRFEDRIIVVRAGDEEHAQEKAEGFAADYEKTSSWKVRKIVDIYEILDRVLGDGTEIYSAFIAHEWADALMKGGETALSPNGSAKIRTKTSMKQRWGR